MTEITIRRGREEDLPWICEADCRALSLMEDKSLFAVEGAEFTSRHISREGFILIAEAAGARAAYLMVRFPGSAPDNLGRDAGLAEEQLAQVAHMESVVVLPEFRGRGLQKRLLAAGEEAARQRGYRWAMATVSPHNPASLQSFLSRGYREAVRKEKYGGLLRCILIRELAVPGGAGPEEKAGGKVLK